MRQREIRQMNGEDTETHRRRPCEDRGRGGVMLSQAKECWQRLAAGQDKVMRSSLDSAERTLPWER